MILIPAITRHAIDTPLPINRVPLFIPRREINPKINERINGKLSIILPRIAKTSHKKRVRLNNAPDRPKDSKGIISPKKILMIPNTIPIIGRAEVRAGSLARSSFISLSCFC